jgi:hypothetical protein
MLFILRQLRRLELQKRSGQYFVYAFGEIVLIVVGILIAVQIGDWKKGKELERQREELIENLKADFRSTLERAEYVIQDTQPKEERQLKYLQAIGGNIPGLSAGEIRALNTRWSVDFQPVLGTYHSAVSTGAIGLIQDSNLKQLVIEFEDYYTRQQALRQMHQEEVFSTTGSIFRLAEIIGDNDVIDGRAGTYPKKFELSDEAFLEVASQKEFYVLQNVSYRVNSSILRLVKRMKAKAEEILVALEGL